MKIVKLNATTCDCSPLQVPINYLLLIENKQSAHVSRQLSIREDFNLEKLQIFKVVPYV